MLPAAAGTLLVAFLVAGYSTQLVENARRLIGGERSSTVASDHRARLETLFNVLRHGVLKSREGQEAFPDQPDPGKQHSASHGPGRPTSPPSCGTYAVADRLIEPAEDLVVCRYVSPGRDGCVPVADPTDVALAAEGDRLVVVGCPGVPLARPSGCHRSGVLVSW